MRSGRVPRGHPGIERLSRRTTCGCARESRSNQPLRPSSSRYGGRMIARSTGLSGGRCVTSGGALKALQRLQNLRAAAFRVLALVLLALDDLLGRLADEIRIAELGVDAFDVGVDLGHFLFEPRLLRCHVDDAL